MVLDISWVLSTIAYLSLF